MTHVEGVDDGHGYGVRGRSPSGGHGVRGLTGNAVFDPNVDNNNVGVFGKSDDGRGVLGRSNTGDGVLGVSRVGIGAVHGINEISTGVLGESEHGIGVAGTSQDAPGVSGFSTNNNGVNGLSERSIGVHGEGSGSFSGKKSDRPIGVRGESNDGIGVDGLSNNFMGVEGVSLNSIGVYGETFGDNQQGVLGITENRKAIGVAGTNEGGGLAGKFTGNVHVTGTINKAAVQFKIDHPLDPANKYLYHSSVESPDMKNIYDGVVALDNKGEAMIELPDWFRALNKDFRYQLTAIGASGPNLYIAEEISEATTNYTSSSNNNGRFKIAGGASAMKVSWQVTGIRNDPYAKAHPIQIEEDKPDEERGYYIHPDLYGQAVEKEIGRWPFPKEKREELARAAHENQPSNL